MALKELLDRIDAELVDKEARDGLRALLQERRVPAPRQRGTGVKALERFLVGFIQAGVDVARRVNDAASHRGSADGIKAYADMLAESWLDASDLPAEAAGIVHHVDAAYVTLRSFLKVVPATTAAARGAKRRCEAALQSVSSYLGLRAVELDRRMDGALSSNRIEELGHDARSEADLSAAWRAIAKLKAPPTAGLDLSRHVPGAEYRDVAGSLETVEGSPTRTPDTVPLYQVWFGTNRMPRDPADPAKGYANERDPTGTVHYGTCTVEIPRTHLFGSLGTPFWKRWLRLKFTDDHLKLRKIAMCASRDEFLAELREELESLSEVERSVLVYLHGYNTSFEQAALRAAQIGFDLKVHPTAFYSWPSMGEVKGYPADIARVEASETQIANFLSDIADRAGANRVHVIAHSMGNRGFARAIARITAHAAVTKGIRFGQIILAAPDLDVDLFKQLAAAYPMISERTTMYVSAKDKALAMSSWLQDSDRAGFTPPITVLDGIDTIEVTNIDLTLLGHGYFAEAEPVLYDIKDLIDANKPPEKRLRVHARAQPGIKYWAISA